MNKPRIFNGAIEKYDISDVEKRNYVICGTNLTTVFGTKGSYAGLRQESIERNEEIARNEEIGDNPPSPT